MNVIVVFSVFFPAMSDTLLTHLLYIHMQGLLNLPCSIHVMCMEIFSGLGEMMPAQLWETTMNPETRLLKQLVVEDAAEANVVFSSLMGSRVCLFLFCMKC